MGKRSHKLVLSDILWIQSGKGLLISNVIALSAYTQHHVKCHQVTSYFVVSQITKERRKKREEDVKKERKNLLFSIGHIYRPWRKGRLVFCLVASIHLFVPRPPPDDKWYKNWYKIDVSTIFFHKRIPTFIKYFHLAFCVQTKNKTMKPSKNIQITGYKTQTTQMNLFFPIPHRVSKTTSRPHETLLIDTSCHPGQTIFYTKMIILEKKSVNP